MKNHDSVREAIARIVPGYEAIETIGASGNEFHIDGRIFHEPDFPTDTRKAKAQVVPLPAFRAGTGEFRLMTLRSEGQFNTVVYEEEDVYRGIDRRDVVMMNERDGQRLQLREGDAVDVTTEAGRMRVVVAFADLPPGNLAMYYPEANVLVPRRVDPDSGTPAFKSVVARIEAASGCAPAATGNL
jgi:anaerobic selenocysteine-containing dehydrogenase